MNDTKVPRTAKELRSALAAASFLEGKVSEERREEFVESTHYRDGGLGHMDYRLIEAALSQTEFARFSIFSASQMRCLRFIKTHTAQSPVKGRKTVRPEARTQS